MLAKIASIPRSPFARTNYLYSDTFVVGAIVTCCQGLRAKIARRIGEGPGAAQAGPPALTGRYGRRVSTRVHGGEITASGEARATATRAQPRATGRRRSDFFIVGHASCATTALFEMLTAEAAWV